jgi:putative flippase GtrA
MSPTPPSTLLNRVADQTAAWLRQHEFLRFLLTGSINTTASWLVYLVLLNVGAPYPLAYSFAYVFGIVFTYYLNTRWVFRVPMSWQTFLQFPLVYVVQYSISMVVLHILVKWLHFPVNFAPLAVIALTMPITFLLSRFVLKR